MPIKQHNSVITQTLTADNT